MLSAGEWGEVTWNRHYEQMRSCHVEDWRSVVPPTSRPTGGWPRTCPILSRKLVARFLGQLYMPPCCPKSVACIFGPSNPCACSWLVDAICLGLRSVFLLLLSCVFYLISHKYKYLPTLVEMVNNKPLPLCWCLHFMQLCRNWQPKISIQELSTLRTRMATGNEYTINYNDAYHTFS